jgi:hypothetical protein
MVLGSVAERFLRIARCPVLLISAHCVDAAPTEQSPTEEAVKELS